jgi:hypothetical protein
MNQRVPRSNPSFGKDCFQWFSKRVVFDGLRRNVVGRYHSGRKFLIGKSDKVSLIGYQISDFRKINKEGKFPPMGVF